MIKSQPSPENNAPVLVHIHGNADRKKQFGEFLATDSDRCWRLKHRRRKANA